MVFKIVYFIEYWLERKAIKKEIELIKNDIKFLSHRTDLDDAIKGQIMYSMLKKIKELELRL